MGRRTVLLITALAVAALGTFAVFAYVEGINDRAIKDQSPTVVLVAKTLIPAGTNVSDAERAGAFKLEKYPAKAVVAGAMSSVGEISDRVAVADIYPGEQIIAAKFALPGTTTALSIPPGKLAMSVQLGDPQRVAGFVRPGSEVAMFVTINPRQGGAAVAGQPVEFTKLLLGRVQVLAVGPTTLRTVTKQPQNALQAGTQAATQNMEQIPTAILTLAVSQHEAQKLVYASSKGELYFALLTKDSKVGPGPQVDIRNLFN